MSQEFNFATPRKQKVGRTDAEGTGIGGTSWTNKIRIQNYNGETVTIKPSVGNLPPYYIHYYDNGQFIEFDSVTIDSSNGNGVSTIGCVCPNDQTALIASHHIRYQNSDLIGCRTTGDLATSSQITNISPNSHDNEFINDLIHGSGGSNATYGFYIRGNNNLYDSCEFYDTGMYGGQVYNGTYTGPGSPSNNIIRNSIFRDITLGMNDGRTAILLTGDDNQAYNNIAYNITAPGGFNGNQGGFAIYQGLRNKIYFNTVVNCGKAISYGGTNSEIKDNLTGGNAIDTPVNEGAITPILSNNITGVNLVTNFVNASGGNLHLLSGSIARSAGVLIIGITTDKDGVLRGNPPDVGVYQFV